LEWLQLTSISFMVVEYLAIYSIRSLKFSRLLGLKMLSVQLLVKSQQKISCNKVKIGEKTTVKDIFSVNHKALRA